MQVVLQGSLRHFPAADLLRFLCGRGQSGTLDLETTGRRTRVLYENDTVLWAESNKVEQPLEAVLDALDWMSGTFTLLDSAVVPENVRAISVPLADVLAESVRRAEAASLFPDSTLFRLVDDPALQQQVSLTGEEFKVLFRLSTGRTFRELVADSSVPRIELAERLKKLERLGLVASVREEPRPEPPSLTRKPSVARKRTLVGSLTPDDRPDSVYPLLDAEYTIGRTPDNGIVLADGSVSAKHARIERTAEGFVLEDLQSRNGTFVNGEKLEGKRLLADGDLIRVGKVMMTFNVARESKAGDTTQPEMHVG